MVSVKLPQELVEEILHRVPPLSLTRFRAVCKRWNSLIDDTKFVNYHMVQSRPQFIFQVDSNIYSVAVNFSDLQIEVYGLPLEIPVHGLIHHEDNFFLNRVSRSGRTNFVDCDGLLFCSSIFCMRLLIWNPWLRQTRLLPTERINTLKYAIGYDNKKQYKLFAFRYDKSWINEIGSASKKVQDMGTRRGTIWSNIISNLISVNGTLYWAAVDVNNGIFIRSFSFSTERLTTFCLLPYKYEEDNVLALAVYRKDRLSLLNLCNKSSTITVWLTKNSINNTEAELEEDVVWLKLMSVLIPNFPKFASFSWFSRHDLTYFLDNEDAKRLVICCYDKNQHVYVYIVKGVMFQKTRVYPFDAHCDQNARSGYVPFPKLHTYIPSLACPSWVNKDNKI